MERDINQYTVLSKEAYVHATFPTLTPEKAAEWVDTSLYFRTLSEKLLKYYPGTAEEMKQLLRRELSKLHPAEKEKESIRKNVNNWFAARKGMDDRTISRNYSVEICFILGLSLDQADEFLRAVNGEGIHYRNREEFVLAYSLNHGHSYDQYQQLRQKMEAGAAEGTGEAAQENFTRTSSMAVRSLQTEEELRRYIQEHGNDFGEFHNTSYAYLMDMMEVLRDGGSELSVSEMVTQNLYRRFVGKSKGLSDIAKSIRSGWPEETYLSKMKNRELEVSRKTLILLYLACGGETFQEEAWDEDELDAFVLRDDAEGDADADFEGIRGQIDAMLTECGFQPLDPRMPFDWMVLFCMATGDLFDLDKRFTAFLSVLFGNEVKE